MFYRSCNGKASCNCAVAVRSGDDVIVVDRCGPTMGKSSKKTPMTLKMFLNGALTEGTEVLRKAGGKKYIVSCVARIKKVSVKLYILFYIKFASLKM